MALVVADRVKETTTTSGTGTYSLDGAIVGFRSFGTLIGDTNTTYYTCTDGSNYEIGIGTYASSGSTLTRTTILKSTNSNNAVDWGSVTKDIFVTYPADKAVYKDASGNVSGLTISTDVQAYDADLTALGGLAKTDSNFIVGNGSTWVAETGATARTSLGLGTAAVLATGISDTNVPKFTSGVADDDFLRVDGTAIEGRSASQVLSDIGGQASLTFGIADTNAVKIDDADAADDDYAKLTASGIEGRSYSEVKTDLSLGNVENTALSSWVGTSNITTLGTIGTGTWQGTAVADGYISSASTWNAKVDTGGTGLTKSSTTLNLDTHSLTEAAIADGDYLVFNDATDSNAPKREALADVATLFAGTGLTASSSVIGVNASQTQITSVGTIGTGTWQGTDIADAYIASEATWNAKVDTGKAVAMSIVFG